MASISIYEKDLTVTTEQEFNDVVYVPGFATKGEVNQPILCRSVKEFIDTFGAPVKITEPADWDSEEEYPGITYEDISGYFTAGTDFAQTTDVFLAVGDYEKSGLFALELLNRGLHVLFERVTDDTTFNVANFYDALLGTASTSSVFYKLLDKNNYNCKFITSGGYPVFGCVKSAYIPDITLSSNCQLMEAMLKVALSRGSVALIDHTDYAERPLVSTGSVYTALNTNFNQEFGENSWMAVKIGTKEDPEDCRPSGAMVSPWFVYKTSALAENINTHMAGSFAYLSALAVSIKTNEDWQAIAGVTRGVIPGFVSSTQFISRAVEQEWSKIDKDTALISINPIMNIRPYGFVIWGNRTMNANKVEPVATTFLNTRVLVVDVKEALYQAATKYMYENNSDRLWVNFKNEIIKTLEKMVANAGISKYSVVKSANQERATLSANITIWVIDPIENFELTVNITDSYVSVE